MDVILLFSMVIGLLLIGVPIAVLVVLAAIYHLNISWVLDQIQALYVDGGEADPSTPTLGAISLWSTTVNLAHAGFEIDRARWPTLVGFLEAVAAHDPLARLVEEERSALASH